MRIRGLVRITVIGALVLIGVMTVAQQTGGLVPAGNPPDVALVFTGDVIGYIEPCG